MAPKKAIKMNLADFIKDESMGPTTSWADEMDASTPSSSDGRTGGSYGSTRRDYGGASSGAGGSSDRYAGYSRADDSDRPARAVVPVPDRPPYNAHVGNLSFEATENEISDFFANCNVTNVRLIRDREQGDRPKGFGYVEFGTKDGLLAALDLNGSQLAGRPVRINVAEPPKDRGDDRTTGEWRRSGPPPSTEPAQRRGGGSSYERYGNDRSDRSDRGDREEGGRRQNSFRESDGKVRDFNNWERKPLSPLPPTSPTASDRPRAGGDREFRRRSPAPSADGDRSERAPRERPQVERQPTAADKDNEWRKGARPDPPQRSTPTSPVLAQSRPKLELKKRSELPLATDAPASAIDSKASPFGGARPIDTTQREKEIEEKRVAAIAVRKAREEKEREEKKAAREAQEKASEAGTPVANKSFDNLRRGSGSVATPEATEEEAKDKPATTEKPQPEKRRTDTKPAPKSPGSWRTSKAEAPKQEGEDGWKVASGTKRGGHGSNRP